MFGLPSIQKLIVLAAVIAAVWYGFKFLGRLQEARKAEAKLREANSGRPAKKGNSPQSAAKGGGQVEDMTQCPSCGAYFPTGGKCSCGRRG